MKYSIVYYMTLLLLATGSSVNAQSISTLEQAMEAMKNVQSFFMAGPVAFDMKYLYSNEHTPREVLDSAQGKIEMFGNNYRCLLEHTETIRNEKYNIILFNDDRIIYLSKVSPEAVVGDPVAMVRSALKKVGAESCNISNQGRFKTIRFGFRQGEPCKQMDVIIDTITQRLTEMHYVVKTSLLTEVPGAEVIPGYEEYALVKAFFFNYSTKVPDSRRFDEGEFFYKEGDDFKTTDAYKEYKLFIGSPNL